MPAVLNGGCAGENSDLKLVERKSQLVNAETWATFVSRCSGGQTVEVELLLGVSH